MTNTIRAFLVLFFFGLLTACGSSGGGNTAASVSTPTTVTVGMVTVTVTLPAPPPMTITTEIPAPPPNPPVTLGFDDAALGALRFRSEGERTWFVVLSVATGGENTVLFGQNIALQRGMVRQFVRVPAISLPVFNREMFNGSGELIPLVVEGVAVTLPIGRRQIAFETNPTITALLQLCPVSWLRTYIDAQFGNLNCPAGAGISYTPNMPNVLHAVLADGFNRGIGIGESRFAFSGRHNGNDRAAGFTYDMGGYALRTDYVHLPSKQDGGVFLDTFRFGIIRPINDETRFFAGVDSCRNAIFAIDTNGENLHRFGIAAGDGYAVRYEYRIRL